MLRRGARRTTKVGGRHYPPQSLLEVVEDGAAPGAIGTATGTIRGVPEAFRGPVPSGPPLGTCPGDRRVVSHARRALHATDRVGSWTFIREHRCRPVGRRTRLLRPCSAVLKKVPKSKYTSSFGIVYYAGGNGSSPLVIPRRRRRTHISSDCDHRRKFRFKREPAGRLTTWGASNPDNIWACQNYKDRAAEGSGAHSRGTSQMRSLHLSVLGTSSNHTGCESDPPPSYLIVD